MTIIKLIAGSNDTIRTIKEQIYSFISPKEIKIIGHALDDTESFNFDCDLLILSSELVFKELIEIMEIPESLAYIIGKRTLNFDYLDKIISIEPTTDVLLVNDLQETSEEMIDNLNELGLDHINYISYYPGCQKDIKNIDIAISPGETRLAPTSVKKVIDIGSRIFDFTTIAKILSHLKLLDSTSCVFSELYLKKIINISKSLVNSKNKAEKLKNDLANVLNGFQEGLLAFDQKGYVTLLNNNLKKLLNIRHQKVENIHLKDIIYNKKLLNYLLDQNLINPYLLEIEGKEIYIQKISSNNSQNTVVSFKFDHQLSIGTQNSKELSKGHLAKYRFEDIVGESESIKKAKNIAKKLSKSDITILIEGESGTGKELFASSIHNHSKRSNEKFLAINFSALPDDLIESELFGYVEGAFTGAKKGGKIGLFQEADGGTIFLDEIGDISLKVQTRLLRVLEEKEIMPIGSNEIIPINVRIIAATNKDLEQLVNQNKFRKDLYFRLKMGYIHLPKLSERKEDIPFLVDYLIHQSTVDSYKIDKQVIKFLKKYTWPGNIRELKNIITYMIAYSETDVLSIADLPQKYYFKDKTSLKNQQTQESNLDKNQIYILNCINRLMSQGVKPSRKKISKASQQDGLNLSINQVRRLLDELEEQELIIKKKGRYGTNITAKGLKVIGA